MSPDRWILPSVRPQHIYQHLLDCTLVPWFPFSLSVGDLASVNGIHQWPVITWWSIMFDLDTFIHMMGHVLAAICVEDLWAWWHFIYATSLTMPVSIGYQFSWLYSSVPLDVFIQHEDLISLYIVRGGDHMWHVFIMPIHGHCIIMYLRTATLHICSHMQRLIIVLYLWVASYSTWVFITALMGWIL